MDYNTALISNCISESESEMLLDYLKCNDLVPRALYWGRKKVVAECFNPSLVTFGIPQVLEECCKWVVVHLSTRLLGNCGSCSF